MITTINQKQLQKAVDAAVIAARLDELNRLEGFLPSASFSRRKGILKKQLSELVGEEEKQEETTIHLRIELPEEKPAKKEKPVKFSLKNFLVGDVQEDDTDDQVVTVVRNLIPTESRLVLGKIVREL